LGSARGECEHAFVTSHGSTYGRSDARWTAATRRFALAAAADLSHVGLVDALELLLLLLESEPSRFERAAARWHGRSCREVRDVDLTEAQAVLACLAGLAARRPKAAAGALAEPVDRRELRRASEVLLRWNDLSTFCSDGSLERSREDTRVVEGETVGAAQAAPARVIMRRRRRTANTRSTATASAPAPTNPIVVTAIPPPSVSGCDPGGFMTLETCAW
jgi:hypothetical protein